MVRILYIGPHESARGGIASVIQTCTRYLADSPFSVRCLATVKDGNRLKKLLVVLKAYIRAPFEIMRADIIHIHTASWNSWRRKIPLVILAKLQGRKLVIHIHGGGFADFLSSMSRCRLWTNTRILSQADCIVCLSASRRAELARYLHATPTVTLPNPCRFIPKEVEVKCRPGLQILFTGLIDESKGVFDLIKAFALVTALCPEEGLKLVLAGKGKVDACRELSRECGIEDKVLLPGWLGSSELRAAYADADIYCLPSYVEGVPMGVLEAMAFALPIVACPVGGVPDVVDDGVHGLFVPPGDIDSLAFALKRLVDNEAERTTMGGAGRKRVLIEYSPQRAYAELEQLYDSLLASGVSVRPTIGNA
jgi:glycosyltransferase involved in cell wall biosynthesis